MNENQGPRYEIGPLLHRAQRKAATAFTDALRPLGLQSKHFGALLVLRRGHGLSQRELIERLDSDKSSMVRMLDDLESRGLCVRTPDTQDRRAYSVRLTDTGHAVFEQAERHAMKVVDELLSGFTAEESQQLRDLLVRFIAD
ncbi:MAG TPA: MarR family transcriptional regulator [Pseudonocardiaceae bacterium]|nr:MarR family transcriptional regulator [Pseudonocardiaceae bacterium]